MVRTRGAVAGDNAPKQASRAQTRERARGRPQGLAQATTTSDLIIKP